VGSCKAEKPIGRKIKRNERGNDEKWESVRSKRRTEGKSKETRERMMKSGKQCHILTLKEEHPVLTTHGTVWALDKRWVCY
jgi:hypothetical protein